MRAFIMLAFVLLGSVMLVFVCHLLFIRCAGVRRAGIRRAGVLLHRLPSCVRLPVVLVFIHCAAECRASVCVHADVDAAVCGGVVIMRVDSY